MQANMKATQVICVADPLAAQETARVVRKAVFASLTTLILAICVVAWIDNHYMERDRQRAEQATQHQLLSCQAPSVAAAGFVR